MAAEPTTDRPQTLASEYAPGQEPPLGSYAMLTATYGAGLAGCLIALRVRGRQLPERASVGDLLLVGVATHKLSRLIAKDRVTSFARAPFTRYEEPSGQGEVEEQPRGGGLRLAIGELVVCPYCLGQWVASGLMVGLVAAPRLTRFVSSVFVAHTVSDFMQIAYRAAEDQL